MGIQPFLSSLVRYNRDHVSMSIEVELIEFLEKRIKNSADKSRNIEIIAYYYGFRDAAWPTLEDTAKKFGVGTRERIRQILNDNFRGFVRSSDLPSTNEFIKLISGKEYWVASGLEQELSDSRLVNEKFSIKGILNLLEDLSLECDFEIYTPELDKTSRNSLDLYENNFLIQRSDIKEIKKSLKKAQGLPGRCGIANLNYIKNELSNVYGLIAELIVNSHASWVRIDSDDFWYIYESRDNTIVNYSEKIFSVINECGSERLAITYRNALDSRSYKYPYPKEQIIQEYLESSIFFENHDGKLSFIGENTKVNDIEKEVILYLKDKTSVKFPEFRAHLRTKDFGDPHIQKATSTSPLVCVDKSGGRTHYTYSLIGSSSNNHEPSIHDARYKEYLLKLRKLLETGTDETLIQKVRREQRILQDWLFKGKSQEECAICNKTYSVNTLVTAHKTKRSICNNAERLDPYIVMPICVMGCDYLYENRYVYISEGTIRKGNTMDEFSAEFEFINDVVGNVIDKRWLRGRRSYFDAPNESV
jgi:hypothetical protein